MLKSHFDTLWPSAGVKNCDLSAPDPSAV